MIMNHIPKDVSDRDPKRDWDRDLNYVRSHALQTPSQSRSGSAHCEIIFCSHCAWLQHGFSARISKMHTHESHSERALRSHVLESGFLRESRSKMPFFSRFKSLIWNSFVFTRAKIRVSNQERTESRSETSFGTWFVLMWTGPVLPHILFKIHTFMSWNSVAIDSIYSFYPPPPPTPFHIPDLCKLHVCIFHTHIICNEIKISCKFKSESHLI